uniref:Uncharacterized protein n=1 Tax=Guillardia theta TaxID=55529 RepID=A0A7S4NQT2_GUITH|mmetsp:Transcript_28613/g.92293  ORF Transcript_28613/g.92293 Transcript_28613/m.92293 type:complete len:111 (+) Transcript_28613:57-389(+)
MGEANTISDPVSTIITLRQYQCTLQRQVNTLKEDLATIKEFQSKYGAAPWKESFEHLKSNLLLRQSQLKEVQFQLDLIASCVKQANGLCNQLRANLGPPDMDVNFQEEKR